MNAPTVALCVGHSRRVNGRPEGGALSHDQKASEWVWNRDLVEQVATILADEHDRYVLVIDNYGDRSYPSAMRWLGNHLREQAVDYAVEFHFNSAGPEANGHEWLHHAASAKGKLAATELHLAVSRDFPNLRARGVKACKTGDRGFPFLATTHCPAVIAEPFFGTNAAEWALVNAQKPKLAAALARGIHSFLHRLS